MPRLRRPAFALARRAPRAARGAFDGTRMMATGPVAPWRRCIRRFPAASPARAITPTMRPTPRFSVDWNSHMRERIPLPPRSSRMPFGRERLVTSPPVARTSMAARLWPRGLLWRLLRSPQPPDERDAAAPSAPGCESLPDSPDPRRPVAPGSRVSPPGHRWPGRLPDLHRGQLHERGAALPWPANPRGCDSGLFHHPLRLDLRRLLDRDGGFRVAAARRRPLRHLPQRSARRTHRSRGTRRDRHADLQ